MTTLGKYEILSELGTGSMGIIYRARDTVLDREVALKTFAQAGSLDPELKERFYREARFCARLHHPNIVTVFDLGEQDGTAFISMELLSGLDLRKFITERHALPMSEKIRVIAAVCDGLEHAHESGIVHRDIKPSNILLTRENVPKILDFGIARFPSSRLTMMGRVLGTPHYMAPEQIMGKPCDARSDIFAVGLVAFELLTYAHPFYGESIPKRIINDQPDSLLAKNPDLPRRLEPVIAKALAKDPAQRYQTAAAFGAAIRAAVELAPGERSGTAIAAVAPPSAPPPSAPMQIPANANTEYKMAEVLAALQAFDASMERRDVAAARTALATIESIAKIDDVYATAAEQSRSRLKELEATAPPPAVVSEPVRETTPAAAPAAPAAAQPWAAQTTTNSSSAPAAVISEPIPAAPRPTVAAPRWDPPPPPPPATATPAPVMSGDVTRFFGDVGSVAPPAAQPVAAHPPVSRPPAPAPKVPPQHPARPVSPDAAARQKTGVLIAAVIGTAVLVIAAAIGTFLLMHRGGVARSPAVATAEIAVPEAHIYPAPDATDALVTLKKGDHVNVLSPPRSRDQEWTQVQYVTGKVYPPGAMRTADLANWTSDRPDTAFALLQAFTPATGASTSDLQDYAQRLSHFVQQFPNAAQRADAQAELARINAAIAGAATTSVALAPTPSAPAVSAPRQAPPRASQETARPAAGLNPEAAVRRATAYWEQGEYDKAERLLTRVLDEKPDYAPARNLLGRVQKAKQLEGGR